MTLRPTVCAALLAGVLPLAAAAQSIDHGPDMPLGAGTVRAFAETDAAGRATRIGIEMTEAAVASHAIEQAVLVIGDAHPLMNHQHRGALACDRIVIDVKPFENRSVLFVFDITLDQSGTGGSEGNKGGNQDEDTRFHPVNLERHSSTSIPCSAAKASAPVLSFRFNS